MTEDIILMSFKEIERLRIIHKVFDKQVTQVKAAEILGLSERQVGRIVKRVGNGGDRSIVHRGRGQRAANKMSEELEDRIGEIVRDEYSDFKPSLAAEKLGECYGIRVGREKLRQIMIERGLWKVRKHRDRHVYQWRERKTYYGEMVQMDGSHHDWLEERGAWLVLMGYIDDATNRFFGRFYDYEGVYPDMDSFEHYIGLYGLPVSVYLDKHSTYKTTRQPDTEELLKGQRAHTQFERAVKELGIKILHAHSPQAKGRIERAFGTLQDRLVKEMRLKGINTKEEANEFLRSYLPGFNEQFMKMARKEGNLHRPLPEEVDLREILCIKATRTINDGYIIRWKQRVFLLDNPSLVLRRQKVEVREHFNGRITLKYKGRYLDCHEVYETKPLKEAKVERSVKEKERKKSKYKPSPEHPWNKYRYKSMLDRC
ncbi:ISNCY family transposase [Acidobacteriota bacterium]